MQVKGKRRQQGVRRVDIQVSIFMAVVVLVTTLGTFGLSYYITYTDMIASLRERVDAIYTLLEDKLDKTTFENVNTPADMELQSYKNTQNLLHFVRNSTGVMYLYTAKQTAAGELVYLVDGLSREEDFRYPGDVLEPEIEGAMLRALAGETVLPDHIQNTDWGKIFITYLPIHNADGTVAGVVGIEFEAEHQFDTYRTLLIAAPVCILLLCVASVAFALLFFRRISNPNYQDMANTDQLTGLKSRNAFEVDLQNRSVRSTRQGAGVLTVDLDYLKKVNDVLGHTVGDEYIRIAAQALRDALKGKAILYRVGGDEFVALFEQADNAQLERETKAVQECFEVLRPDWPVPTSLSIGGAVFNPTLDVDLACTYRRADAVMYEAKRLAKKQRQE